MFAVMHNAGAAQISIRHHVMGPVITHSEACASSAVAIADGCRAIRSGEIDLAIAGGAEAPLTDAVFGAWNAMRVLAPPDPVDVARSCRPFDRSRAGVVLGEGSAFFVLEAAECAERRGIPAYAEVCGFGIGADAHHIGAPQLEGEVRTIRAALRDAHLEPQDIDCYNAHATGTRAGDAIEAGAIRQAFGEHATRMPVSAPKSVHGHVFGATSAIELMIAMVGMVESFLPATASLDDVDPECALNHVAKVPVESGPMGRALSFSAGFGGTNAAIVLGRCADGRGITTKTGAVDSVSTNPKGD